MAALSYGLNITKKAAPTKLGPVKRRPIFEEDELDGDDGTRDGENIVQEIGSLDEGAGNGILPSELGSGHSDAPPAKRNKTSVSIYGDLSSSRVSKLHSDEATSIVTSIYDYDAAFESLHAASQKKKAAEAEDAVTRKPKYMSNLLAAAEVRKRDQLRAKEKLLAREREAEGDEYGDKERFVTGAYKVQQEEVRRLEEEEKLREEEDERRRRGKGMVGFYRNVLNQDEKRHEEAVTAASQVVKSNDPSAEGEQRTEEEVEGKKEADMARELKARGHDITVNDEGQVVDKRQLLSAGLNVAPKPRPGGASSYTPLVTQSIARQFGQSGPQSKAASQQAMRERQSRMIEEQLEQSSKQAADEEAERRAALERTTKSKKTETDVMSAKERYLQRKREAEQVKRNSASS